jgi:hypothetical protein
VNTLHERRNADVFNFSFKDGAIKSDSILRAIRSGNYDEIVVSVDGYSLRPARNYGISKAAIGLFDQLQKFNNTKNYVFGNVLAIKNFLSASQLVACYQDDDITQYTAADQYAGLINAKGRLPVSIGEFKYGFSAYAPPNYAFDKFYQVDSIVSDGIDRGAFPGCVVLAAKDGK